MLGTLGFHVGLCFLGDSFSKGSRKLDSNWTFGAIRLFRNGGCFRCSPREALICVWIHTSHVSFFFRLTKQKMQFILIKSDINCAAHRSKKTTKQNTIQLKKAKYNQVKQEKPTRCVYDMT